MLVEDVIVDVVGVFHGLPHLREWLRRSITRCALPNFSIIHESRLGTTLQHLFSVRVTKVAGSLRPTSP
jgi:hypothetical protein